MTFTPDMLRTIRLNAGRVPKHNLANDLGISVNFLERIAKEHGYDLRLVVERDPDPALTTSAHDPLPRAPHRCGARHTRTVSVTTTLFSHDVAALDEVAARLGLRRSRVMSRIIEVARAKGMLLALARLPAPNPNAGKEEGA